MATSWPQARAWPTEAREHATYINNQVEDSRNVIPSRKIQNTPDVRSIQETLNIMRNEAKEAASITSLTLNEMRDDMEHTTAQLQMEL
ncbi:hypothetical protein F5B17DRAFT_434739 [Nemania serpens]|nr:hypothetical protein F5B17DRAFT_434739 [Nemania serpens]